jgi:hypothetical protein
VSHVDAGGTAASAQIADPAGVPADVDTLRVAAAVPGRLWNLDLRWAVADAQDVALTLRASVALFRVSTVVVVPLWVCPSVDSHVI